MVDFFNLKMVRIKFTQNGIFSNLEIIVRKQFIQDGDTR